MEAVEGEQLATPGGRLRWIREVVLGLSNDRMAELLAGMADFDVAGPTVSRYETGNRNPPLEYYVAVAEVSGVSLDWIILGRGELTTAGEIIERMRDALDRWQGLLGVYVPRQSSGSAVTPAGTPPTTPAGEGVTPEGTATGRKRRQKQKPRRPEEIQKKEKQA